MEYVLLLHGLGSHSLTMKYIEKYFIEHSKYNILTYTYQSLFFSSVYSITKSVVNFLNSNVSHGDTVHFIGHSLGGIISKSVASNNNIIFDSGRIVTLGTPHKGAVLADVLLEKFPFINSFSPIVEELSFKYGTVRNINYDSNNIGVIIGDSNFSIINPLIILGNIMLRQVNNYHDGVVCVSENYINELKHVKFIKCNHVSMIWNINVAKQSLMFISSGEFY